MGHHFMGVAAFLIACIANVLVCVVLMLMFSAMKDYLPAIYNSKRQKLNAQAKYAPGLMTGIAFLPSRRML